MQKIQRRKRADGDVEKTMATVIEMMGRLEAVLKKENDALRAMDRQKFLDLQLEKVSLAKNYEIEAQKLMALRGNIGKAGNDLKKSLKESHTSFSEHADENLNILLHRKDGANRLNRRIMEAARDALVQKEERYDSSGKMYQSGHKKTLSSGVMDSV